MMQPAQALPGALPLYRQHSPAASKHLAALNAVVHTISDAVFGTYIDKDESQWITDRSN